MFDLQNLKPKTNLEPPRFIFYGPPGKGKSTTAAQAENHIFLNLNDGLNGIPHTAFPIRGTGNGADIIRSFDEVMTAMVALYNQDHPFRCLILDGLSDLEKLIFSKVCADYNTDNIAKAAGGYGKGYVDALRYFNDFLGYCDMLRRQKGMAIVLLAHSDVKQYTDPMTESYDRHVLKMQKELAFRVHEWVDAVLFFNAKAFVSKRDDGGLAKHGKATDGGLVIYTSESARHQAKNRYGMRPEIPMSWDSVMGAMAEGMAQKNAIFAQTHPPQPEPQPQPQAEIHQSEPSIIQPAQNPTTY